MRKKNSKKYIWASLTLTLLVLTTPFLVNALESYPFITKWGSAGEADSQFYRPGGVAADSSGNVYVADTQNNRIQKFNSNGTFIAKWGKNEGDGNYGSGDGEFEWPQSVAATQGGTVYVADTLNNRIQQFTSDGQFSAKWGSLGSGDGQFNSPMDIAIDSGGFVYVADTGNYRIQKFNADGTELHAKWGNYGTGDGQFKYPMGIAVDSNHNVYVTDYSNHRVQKFNSDGTLLLAKWGSSGDGDGEFQRPVGIAVDSTNNVYVADTGNKRIQKFDSSGTLLAVWGSYGSGNGEFDVPEGVAVDLTSGNVYVADTHNNRIQKFGISAPVDTESPKIVQGLTTKTSGSYIKGTINLRTNVTDNIGVTLVQYFRNSLANVIGSSSTSPYSVNWNTKLNSNGSYYIYTYARDAAGNSSSAKTLLNVDNYKPRTKAPYSRRVKKGGQVRLYYKVADPYTGNKAYVTIKIKKGTTVVKTISLGKKTINKSSYYLYTAKLAKGKYKFYIYAKDLADNTQYNVASNYLTIY